MRSFKKSGLKGQTIRCDLYDTTVQGAYIGMNWADNLSNRVIGVRAYSKKEMADLTSLQSRHVPEMVLKMVPKMAPGINPKAVWTMN